MCVCMTVCMHVCVSLRVGGTVCKFVHPPVCVGVCVLFLYGCICDCETVCMNACLIFMGCSCQCVSPGNAMANVLCVHSKCTVGVFYSFCI